MKKQILLFGVFALLALASCNKEKTCVCTTKSTGFPDATQTMTIQDGDCSDMNATQTMSGITQTITCVEE